MKLRYIAARLVKTVLVAIAVVVLSFFLNHRESFLRRENSCQRCVY